MKQEHHYQSYRNLKDYKGSILNNFMPAAYPTYMRQTNSQNVTNYHKQYRKKLKIWIDLKQRNRLIIKNALTKTSSSSDSFIGEFYLIFKEAIPVLHKCFFKKERKEHFPTHSVRPVLSWYPNHWKKRKLQINNVYEQRHNS